MQIKTRTGIGIPELEKSGKSMTTKQDTESNNHSNYALQLLERKNTKKLCSFLSKLHPVELAALVNSVDSYLQPVLLKHIRGLDQLARFIAFSSDNLQNTTLKLLNDPRIAAVIRRMECDDASRTIRKLSRKRQLSVLKRLSRHRVEELNLLLAYDYKSAGSIMTSLYLNLPGEISAEEAFRNLRRNLQEQGTKRSTNVSYIYVTDEREQLLGICSLRELLSADGQTTLGELMTSELVSVSPEDSKEFVAHLIADYDFVSIPVLCESSGKMLGIITIDDVLDVIKEEHTTDMLKLAGTENDDTVTASVLVAIRSRFPWLCASWLGGITAALILDSYSHTLETMVALAFFMPVVFGMGGNVGSQSSTITVRGIATGDLGRHNVYPRLKKEALIGGGLGLIFGVLLACATLILFRDFRLVSIVGTSIAFTMTCSACLGSMLPAFFESMGFDPAVASGPLVTTSTDLLSMIIYFTTASLLI